MLDMSLGNFDTSDVVSSLFAPQAESIDRPPRANRARTVSEEVELPDEVQVIELLEADNGVSWQQEIMFALEWSPSKTSRRLSTLEESEQITRFQIGRRKVVCLPDCEPEYLQRRR